MSDFELLTSQRNEVFKIIEASGLDPAKLHWEHGTYSLDQGFDIRQCPDLFYAETGFYFHFLPGGYEYSPGESFQVASSTRQVDWQAVQSAVRKWLGYLKREINEPDLWVQLQEQGERVQFELEPVAKNLPFTAEEADRVVGGLSQIRDFLLTNAENSAAQRMLIESRLDYLIHAARTHKKVDWLNIAVGTLVQLMVALAIDPDRARYVWSLLKSAVTGIIQLLPHVP